MSDAIAAQQLPRRGDFAKPVLHLRDDEAAKLDISEGVSAEHTDGNQVFPLGSVSGSNLRDHAEIVDGTGAVAVKHQDGKRHRRHFGGIVEASDAARSGLDFANEMRGGGTVRGNDDGASAQGFTSDQRQFVFVESIDARVAAESNRRGASPQAAWE